MTDKRDDKEAEETEEEPARELREGLTHLWRAARGAAAEIRKEMARTDVGRAIDEAGRDLARAAANVVERLSTEIGGSSKAPDAKDRGTSPSGSPSPASTSSTSEPMPNGSRAELTVDTETQAADQSPSGCSEPRGVRIGIEVGAVGPAGERLSQKQAQQAGPTQPDEPGAVDDVKRSR